LSVTAPSLPDGACGCGTFELTEDGRIDEVELTFSNPGEAAESAIQLLKKPDSRNP
jgi:hypothetical protein